MHDGPFVKGLDAALQSFHVHRQQYFGGAFIGNQKFDLSGSFICAFGRPGKGKGEFNCPSAVLVDFNDRLIVADQGNSRIQILTSKGYFFSIYRSKQVSRSGLEQYMWHCIRRTRKHPCCCKVHELWVDHCVYTWRGLCLETSICCQTNSNRD